MVVNKSLKLPHYSPLMFFPRYRDWMRVVSDERSFCKWSQLLEVSDNTVTTSRPNPMGTLLKPYIQCLVEFPPYLGVSTVEHLVLSSIVDSQKFLTRMINGSWLFPISSIFSYWISVVKVGISSKSGNNRKDNPSELIVRKIDTLLL